MEGYGYDAIDGSNTVTGGMGADNFDFGMVVWMRSLQRLVLIEANWWTESGVASSQFIQTPSTPGEAHHDQ